MDLNVPTIAQRKAARRAQVPVQETVQPAAPSAQPLPEHQLAELTQQSVNPAPIQTSSSTQPLDNLAPTRPIPTQPSMTSVTADPKIDKDTLIALARSMGLEIAAPKKIWIKHSYSVTPETKQKFADYCDVLGAKMQDGLEEAFQDWFKKKELEFKAVSDAKNS